MKKTYRYTLFLAVLIGFLASCTKNDDNNNNINNDDPRTNFVGTWLCAENSHLNGTSSYTVIISLDQSNSAQILLANFYGTNQKVYGVVANTNVTVPSQSVGGKSARGSGTLISNSTKINWNYYVTVGGDIDTCSAVYTKQ